MDTIENSNDNELHNTTETLEMLQNKCAVLEHEKQELAAKVKWYEEQFRIYQNRRFGASSEKTSPEQLSFFNVSVK